MKTVDIQQSQLRVAGILFLKINKLHPYEVKNKKYFPVVNLRRRTPSLRVALRPSQFFKLLLKYAKVGV